MHRKEWDILPCTEATIRDDLYASEKARMNPGGRCVGGGGGGGREAQFWGTCSAQVRILRSSTDVCWSRIVSCPWHTNV